ncbi:hypothetical protein [Weissella cibaria]|nr:hypothetical protein [Weissella cibaria]
MLIFRRKQKLSFEEEVVERRRRGEDVSIYKLARPQRSGWLNRLFFGGI